MFNIKMDLNFEFRIHYYYIIKRQQHEAEFDDYTMIEKVKKM
jgi:hypothetical protein